MKSHREQHFETPDALRHDAHTLVEDAETLLEATKEIVEENVKVAREQLYEAIGRSREAYGGLQKKVLQGARMANHTIHERPYQTACIALGVGAMLGILFSRRR